MYKYDTYYVRSNTIVVVIVIAVYIIYIRERDLVAVIDTT